MRKKFPKSRKLVLLLVDIALVIFSAIIAMNLCLKREIMDLNHDLYSGMIPIMVVLMGILFNINGLFTLERKRYAEILLSLAVAMFNLTIVMMAITFFVREFSYSRGVLIVTVFLQFITLSMWKYVYWRLARRVFNNILNTLIVGSIEECTKVYSRLKIRPEMNLRVKYISTNLEKHDWKNVIKEIDAVVICSDLGLQEKARIVHFCNMNDKQVLLIPDIYEVFCSNSDLEKIDDVPVFSPHPLVLSLEQRVLKRALDISISWTAGIIVSPLLILTALAIKIFDPGPILYSQVRIGQYEKEFKVYKFRTMKVNAEKYSGPMLATDNDPRITKLGKFMRATRLDELPQIWNVIAGDMSIVGPRPERPFFVEQFKQEIPEYIYRHNVKPGITGLAQVYGKYNTTAYDKLVYDLMYIQKCNIINDLTIIIQTVRVLAMKSATEGVGANKKKVDLSKFEVSNVYGDF